MIIYFLLGYFFSTGLKSSLYIITCCVKLSFQIQIHIKLVSVLINQDEASIHYTTKYQPKQCISRGNALFCRRRITLHFTSLNYFSSKNKTNWRLHQTNFLDHFIYFFKKFTNWQPLRLGNATLEFFCLYHHHSILFLM